MGLEPSLYGIQIDVDGNPVLNEAQKVIFDRELKKLIDQGLELATIVLKERWPLVRAVTAELLKKGTISEERFNELKTNFEKDHRGALAFEDFSKRQETRKERIKTAGGVGASCATLLGSLLNAKSK